MSQDARESTWIICSFFAAIAVTVAILMPTPYDKEPESKIDDREVRASNMMDICFPDKVYVQAAHKHCKKFKEDLTEHMTVREKEVAEKCLRDGVNINKCVKGVME